jgi:hypothetical protein
MAELPTIRELQVRLQNAPNAPMPQVNFGERQAAGVEFRAQAQMQGAVGDVLDRMTRSVFGMAGEMSQRAGLQFAAENPLTAEQLQAMAKGDMSTVKLGSPLNVFNSAVRKARAIEISGHAEIEGRDKLVKLLAAVDRGEATTQDVRDQVTSLTNGYSQAIAKVDPEASFKFRAAMSTAGGQVIEKTAQLDAKKRLVQNAFKLQTDIDSKIKLIETYLTNERPIDPSTQKPFDINVLINAEYQNFINNASSMVGTTQASQLGQQFLKSIGAAKANVISNAVINGDKQIGGDFLVAVGRLQKGTAGIYSDVYNSMTLEQRAAMRNEMRSQTIDIERAQDRARTLGKENVGKEVRQLTSDFYTITSIMENPDATDNLEVLAQRRQETLTRLNTLAITTGVVSVDYVRSLPGKAQDTGPRNYRAEAELIDDIKTNKITKEQFWDESNKRGIPPKVAADMFPLFDPAAAREDDAVLDFARSMAGTIRGQFNVPARKQEEIINFRQNVNQEFDRKMTEWQMKGRVTAPPTKSQIAEEIFNKQRSSKVQDRMDFVVKDASSKYGVDGTIKKTRLNFESLEFVYDANGSPIDLNQDLIEQLRKQGLIKDDIDSIRQYALTIERLRIQRGFIK